MVETKSASHVLEVNESGHIRACADRFTPDIYPDIYPIFVH